MRTLALALTFLLAGALPLPAAALSSARVDVLIQFRSAPTASDLRAVTAAGGDVSFSYQIVPALAASVPEAALAGLRANPRVALIELDSLLYALEYRSTHDWGIGHINADDVHDQATPNTGAGVSVAVIDSGIDCDHLELPASRCIYGKNFVTDPASDDADDDYGHGTHVAGTIAAQLHGTSTAPVSGGVVGVAPSATVVAYKTLDSGGVGAWSRHIAAIDHIVTNKTAQIVNMSIGRGDYSSVAEAAMQAAYEKGVLLVAAAGNGGNCGGKGSNLSYPALFESVVAVAAVDSSDARPCWSSTGDKVELTAPGVSVFSTWPADLPASYRDPQPVTEDGDGDGEIDDRYYKYGSGTSMSSPHVAGAAALVLASGTLTDANNSNGLADELRQRLASTAVDLGSVGRDPQFGHGLVDAAAAVGAAATDPGAGDGGYGTSSLVLSASGEKVKGEKLVTLTWTDSSDTKPDKVDVYRDADFVTTTENDGSFAESLGRGGGSYTYTVCHSGADPPSCSNEVTVEF